MTEDVWWFPACLHRQRAGRWDGKPCPVCHMPGINMSTLSKYEFIYCDAVSAYPKYLDTMPATYLQFQGVNMHSDYIAPTNSGKNAFKLAVNSLYGKKPKMGYQNIKVCDECKLVIGDREKYTDMNLSYFTTDAPGPFYGSPQQVYNRAVVHTDVCMAAKVVALLELAVKPGVTSSRLEVSSHEGTSVR